MNRTKLRNAALWSGAMALAAFVAGSVPAQAQNVKITSLGAVPGELCALDRALLFEDPSGVNILIQPGRTVNVGESAAAFAFPGPDCGWGVG